MLHHVSLDGAPLVSAFMFRRPQLWRQVTPRPTILPRASFIRYGTKQNGSATTTSVGSSTSLVETMSGISPKFEVPGKNISVLETPSEFYQNLLVSRASCRCVSLLTPGLVDDRAC